MSNQNTPSHPRRFSLPVSPLVLGLAAWLAGPALAELSPSTYTQMQNSALEQLTIVVTQSVTSPAPSGKTDKALVVEAQARVTAVTKTISGKKPGSQIVIRYLHDPLPPDWTGPGPVPVLVKGKQYQAYLFPGDDGSFAPVAGRMSFVAVGGAPSTGPSESSPSTNQSSGRETVVCGEDITLSYRRTTTLLRCTPEGTGQPRTFRFRREGNPNSLEVIGLVQPYITTLRSLKAMPGRRGKSAGINFQDRIVLELHGKKVTDLRMEVPRR